MAAREQPPLAATGEKPKQQGRPNTAKKKYINKILKINAVCLDHPKTGIIPKPQFGSVIQSCPTLCDPLDHRTRGLKPGPWKNCLPRNWPLVPKRLGAAGLKDSRDLTRLKQDPGMTPHCVQPMVSRSCRQASLPAAWGEGSQLQEELRSGGLLIYQGNQQRGTPLNALLISIVENSDLKPEQSLAGAWGEYVGRSVCE